MDRSHALRVSGRRARRLIWQSQPLEDGNALQKWCHLRHSLRMPPNMWPSTIDGFWAYWNQKIETLDGLDTEFVQGPAASKPHSNLAEAAKPGSKAADEPVAARNAV